jgi:hypothetical protein
VWTQPVYTSQPVWTQPVYTSQPVWTQPVYTSQPVWTQPSQPVVASQMTRDRACLLGSSCPSDKPWQSTVSYVCYSAQAKPYYIYCPPVVAAPVRVWAALPWYCGADLLSACPQWALHGECVGANSAYIMANCKTSCFPDCTDAAAAGNSGIISNVVATPQPQRVSYDVVNQVISRPTVDCGVDLQLQCPSWAQLGLCTTDYNRAFMLANCARTCNTAC